MDDVRGDVLRPPHDTTPPAVKSNKNQKWDPLRAMKWDSLRAINPTLISCENIRIYVDRKLCPKGHCSASVMPNSDPEGQSFLFIPNSHGRFFSLHTLSVFTAFYHFKDETFTNILTETQSFFCSCCYINLVERVQLHVYIIRRVAIS